MTANDVCSMLVVYALFDRVLQYPRLFITNFKQVYHEIFLFRNIYFAVLTSG